MKVKVLEVYHELLYDKDAINIQVPVSEREKVQEWLSTINIQHEKEYDIEIKRHRTKRSIDANSYYWVLIGKIASVLGASKTEIHNQELAKYGSLLTDSDGKVLYCLCKASIDYLGNEQVHLKPTGKTENRNGVTYEWFQVLKNSHDMNSKEFSDLLDGVIQDAKDLSIEVLSPDEIARMKGLEDGR